MFKIKNAPSAPVAAPILVPTMTTFTPGNGSPLEASTTVPAIFPVVPAHAAVPAKNMVSNTTANTQANLRNHFDLVIVTSVFFKT
jgi:hypothetical protein